ncbi:CocE/NonD family hydrolase [Halomonas citrativorans]|uniref:CocE/NonD family hydrolase n=1 Tax=Halomonas citrativorans TaxID=2742612 RepID=A0ABR9FBP1_9GAMM|nr:CocE/NonD family hydrolase [Halomonas citrativorans]MBE0403859.1 CocE/NonD family hydrolase [Halomonas citrativorans]
MEVINDFPYNVREIENVFIPMRDGKQLAARIWLPETSPESPFPALMEYIPYRKRDITRGRDASNHPYLAGHGYVCVRVDMRGSGDSDGVLTDEYTQQEQLDAVDAIEWIARQAWCDGNVGMMGISWGGFNSLQVAAKQPPALKAIISLCSSDDLYADNMHYMGGCLLGDNLSEATVMLAFNALPPDPLIVGDRWRGMWHERMEDSGLWIDKWLRHQRRDAYWTTSSVCENYDAIRCPVYAIGGWADGFTNTVFRLMEHLDVPRKGLIGPWGHKYPHQGIPGPAIGFLQEALRWWDYWLKGDDNGIMDEPMLRAWEQDSVPPDNAYEDRPGRWLTESEWPSSNLQEQCFVLSPYRLTPQTCSIGTSEPNVEPATMGLQSPLSVGLSAGKWCSYAATPDLPGDQREEDGGSLVFSTDALTESLNIFGTPSLELEVSSNQPQAMLAVRLSDVAPDGKATRVTYGLLNLTHRDSNAEPTPLEPHRTYRVTIEMNGIAQKFPAGHQLRLSISTSYWPLAWLPPKPAQVNMTFNQCVLKLPVRTADHHGDGLTHFGASQSAPPLEITHLAPSKHNWLLHQDLAAKGSTLEVINDQGCFRINDTGTEIHRCAREYYTTVGNDFTSARGETMTESSFQRDDWHTEVYTRTVLSCTETDFIIHAQMDAYEGQYRVFSKNWESTIPRDLL